MNLEKTIVFTSLKNIAILKVTLDRDVPDAKVMEEFKRLISMWVRDTKNGKELWLFSEGDINIGDMSCYDKEFSKFVKCLSKKNRGYILSTSIISSKVNEAIPFDTKLAAWECRIGFGQTR